MYVTDSRSKLLISSSPGDLAMITQDQDFMVQYFAHLDAIRLDGGVQLRRPCRFSAACIAQGCQSRAGMPGER